MTPRRVRLDDELLELLADEPELLAIADAIVETQRPRRRVPAVGLVAIGAGLACLLVLVLALWPSSRSPGIADNTAVAAIGGQARLVSLEIDTGAAEGVSLRYDRALGRLTVAGPAPSVTVSSDDLPPVARSLARGLGPRFGAAIGPAVSLVVEYPKVVESGHVRAISAPDGRDRALRWVEYESSLGYPVEVGLARGSLAPRVVLRPGSAALARIRDVNLAN
jgi:hypothetical protein